MSDGTTHWEDCWRVHPGCALRHGIRLGLEAAKSTCEMVSNNAEDAGYPKARTGARACMLMICGASAESIAKEAEAAGLEVKP